MFEIDCAGWLPAARHRPSPNYNSRPPGVEANLLVIHNISLPPGQFGGPHIEALFTNVLDCTVPAFADLDGLRVSAHFLIRRDGDLIQFVSCLDRAWHAGVSCFAGRDNCNDFSVGVELEGTDWLPYTAAQYRRLAALTGALQRRFRGLTDERITGHSDIAPHRKTDPGPAFDWCHFRHLLRIMNRTLP